MSTDTTERGLERLICRSLAGDPCDPPTSATPGEPTTGYGGVGWCAGNPHDYNRESALIWCNSAHFCNQHSRE